MKTNWLFLCIIFATLVPCQAAESEASVPRKLTDRLTFLEPNRIHQIHDIDFVNKITMESKKHADGGFIADITVVMCFDALSYRYTGGRYKDEELTFRLHTPPRIQPGQKYPLIVYFHGLGESNNDNMRQLAHLQHTLNLLMGPESLDCFILATHCPSDNKNWHSALKTKDGKDDAPLTYTKEILEEILNVYPIDQARISGFGVCSGAGACWSMAGKYPDLFCSIATTQLSTTADDPISERLKGVNIWFFNNLDDSTIPVEPIETIRTRLYNQGCNVSLTKRRGGHDSWSYALSTCRILAWLAAGKKESSFPIAGQLVFADRNNRQIFLQFLLPLTILATAVLITRKVRK